MYERLTTRTDPNDPIVAEEIKKGMRHVYGVTDIHDHLPRLRAAARGNVLEIGVRFGASTSALLSGVEKHGGHVYSVDIEDCLIFLGHPQWTFIWGDSKEAELVKERIPASIDLLFVDGDHSYEGAFSDLINFGPMAKITMVHDANENENPDVLRAVKDYCVLNHKKCLYYPESHGLAVIS
jgi:hypothetical protein